MKNSIIIIASALIGFTGLSQNKNEDHTEVITKYITTFPNGDEAITIIESSNANVLKLTSIDGKHRYEILDLANHELVHKETNSRKDFDIDKTKLEDGNYTLKIYTSDFMISSGIRISNKVGETVNILNNN